MSGDGLVVLVAVHGHGKLLIVGIPTMMGLSDLSQSVSEAIKIVSCRDRWS